MSLVRPTGVYFVCTWRLFIDNLGIFYLFKYLYDLVHIRTNDEVGTV